MEKLVYITAHWNRYSKEFDYGIQNYEPSDGSEFVLLEARSIPFETPNDVTMRLRVAEALRSKKNKVLADAHVEAKEIEETIQEMLAIEDKSTDAPSSNFTGGEDDIPF